MSISPLTKMAAEANIHDLLFAALAALTSISFGVAGIVLAVNNGPWYVTSIFLALSFVAIAGIYPTVSRTLTIRARLDRYYRIPQEKRHLATFPVSGYRPGR